MGKIKAHQKLPVNRKEREALRNKGQFWTPDWVAKAMVSYVADKTDSIFDPATGRGAFLKALLSLRKPNISFFGIDIDADVLSDDIYSNKRCSVEQRDFIKAPPKGCYRGIVGNPPYIRHHRIDDKTKALLKKLSLNITGQAIDGRAGYHIYFLIQALNLLEKDGKLAFIMPADTCEGKFAKHLWDWISKKFNIECVITFDEKATPFPNVDTNAIVFLIRNAPPSETLYWVKANEAHSKDILSFVSSGFRIKNYKTLEIASRQLKEAISTGLSRPEQVQEKSRYSLNDFAQVMRGIATGSNEFFFLTRTQVKELKIPPDFLKRAIGRTKDATENIITHEDMEQLEKVNRPTYLFAVNGHDKFPASVLEYLKQGEEMGLPGRSLIKQRKPWYKMEKRQIPPLLFAYLGRRSTRFIKNEAGVLPLTGFLCVYPLSDTPAFINKLWQALNHPDTLKNLRLVGKSYGSGAIKVEPGNLKNLPIPDHVVKKFGLKGHYKTETRLRLFQGQDKK